MNPSKILGFLVEEFGLEKDTVMSREEHRLASRLKVILQSSVTSSMTIEEEEEG